MRFCPPPHITHTHTHPPPPHTGLDLEPTVACIALVRQLANSDTNKADILSAGGGDMLLCLLQAYSNPAGWDVTEQVLGTLCALTLRNPEASEALMELGVLDAVMEVLQEGYQQATAAGVGKKVGGWGRGGWGRGGWSVQVCLDVRWWWCTCIVYVSVSVYAPRHGLPYHIPHHPHPFPETTHITPTTYCKPNPT